MEATEKKILLEQLRELTVIVDLQEKEIEELKKSAADVEEEKEYLHKKKKEIEQDQKLIDRIFMDLGESAGESLKREPVDPRRKSGVRRTQKSAPAYGGSGKGRNYSRIYTFMVRRPN